MFFVQLSYSWIIENLVELNLISAEKEADEEGESSKAHYDVIVKNSEGYWEVEVNCDDGSIGEVEGPDSKPDRE